MPHTLAAVQAFAAAYTEAWCSGDPAAVASHYAPDGQIIINGGEPHKGTEAMTAMAAAFHAAYPGLKVICDDVRSNGTHALYAWTLEGTHGESGNFVRLKGWEEWELTDDLKVAASFGWFDAEDEARQIAGDG